MLKILKKVWIDNNEFIFYIMIGLLIYYLLKKIKKFFTILDNCKKAQYLIYSSGPIDASLLGSTMIVEGGAVLINELRKDGLSYKKNLILIIVIFIGFVIKYLFSRRIFILNFLKNRKIDIIDSKKIKNMKIRGYEVNEIPINIVRLFNNTINEKSSKLIVEAIKEEADYFLKKSDGFKSGFTGMGSIPYTMLLGTYLSDKRIDKYLEYDANKQEYYELSSKESKTNFKSDMQFNSEDIISDIEYVKEIVITISLTHEVLEKDIDNFKNLNRYEIKCYEIRDNKIRYIKQLQDYTSYIVDKMIEKTKVYPKLETIHLLSAIPSCLSLELGKLISNKSKRLPEVISYHYDYNSDPKYVFGISINNNKGKFFKTEKDRK